MTKSLCIKDFRVFLMLLRETRRAAGLTQEQLAERLGQRRTFVSKYELSNQRLDSMEVWAFCRAMGVGFLDFVEQLERQLSEEGG